MALQGFSSERPGDKTNRTAKHRRHKVFFSLLISSLMRFVRPTAKNSRCVLDGRHALLFVFVSAVLKPGFFLVFAAGPRHIRLSWLGAPPLKCFRSFSLQGQRLIQHSISSYSSFSSSSFLPSSRAAFLRVSALPHHWFLPFGCLGWVFS